MNSKLLREETILHSEWDFLKSLEAIQRGYPLDIRKEGKVKRTDIVHIEYNEGRQETTKSFRIDTFCSDVSQWVRLSINQRKVSKKHVKFLMNVCNLRFTKIVIVNHIKERPYKLHNIMRPLGKISSAALDIIYIERVYFSCRQFNIIFNNCWDCSLVRFRYCTLDLKKIRRMPCKKGKSKTVFIEYSKFLNGDLLHYCHDEFKVLMKYLTAETFIQSVEKMYISLMMFDSSVPELEQTFKKGNPNIDLTIKPLDELHNLFGWEC
ncbi:unnamed protein product [Moneuplotes crassus]|uniref:Uncharacterized protein n=1 Tax=Euplotes crassus TaxID=5936 RepID=A0AAD1XRJ2_EUPCR|nr:unnamed protein product [Moneuplotes crassus]